LGRFLRRLEIKYPIAYEKRESWLEEIEQQLTALRPK
jgi:hypothetical protein